MNKRIKTLLSITTASLVLAISSMELNATSFQSPEVTDEDTYKFVCERIAEGKELLDVSGKDITVLVENTGVGKSTLINLLCDVPMEVNYDTTLVVKDDFDGPAAVVVVGGSSITKLPEHFVSKSIGDIYDLPGFQDTDEAVDDVES